MSPLFFHDNISLSITRTAQPRAARRQHPALGKSNGCIWGIHVAVPASRAGERRARIEGLKKSEKRMPPRFSPEKS